MFSNWTTLQNFQRTDLTRTLLLDIMTRTVLWQSVQCGTQACSPCTKAAALSLQEFPNAPLDGADAALDADLPAEGDGEAAFMNEPLYDERGNIVGEPVYDDDGNVVDYIQEGLYDDEENPPDEEEGLPEEYADLEGKPCWPALLCEI